MSSPLDNPFNPKERYSDFNIADEDRVLAIILSLGSSYPNEIAKHLVLMTEQISAIIQKLINKEFVKRIIPDQFDPQPLIRCRIGEMQSQGVLSYADFCNRSWVISTEKGFWYFADKFNGQQRHISGEYLKTYPNIDLMARMNGAEPVEH